MINGRDIKEYDLEELRGVFGLVSQEAMLFEGTIRENIVYNYDGEEEEIDEGRLKKVAEEAYALKFIEGYEVED